MTVYSCHPMAAEVEAETWYIKHSIWHCGLHSETLTQTTATTTTKQKSLLCLFEIWCLYVALAVLELTRIGWP